MEEGQILWGKSSYVQSPPHLVCRVIHSTLSSLQITHVGHFISPIKGWAIQILLGRFKLPSLAQFDDLHNVYRAHMHRVHICPSSNQKKRIQG